MADIEAIDLLLKWAREHPEEHNQGWWATRRPGCSTSYCIAGKAVTDAGWEMMFLAGNEKVAASICRNPVTGETRGIPQVAQELLDLSEFDAFELFDSWNALADLERIRDRLAAERVKTAEPTS